jgi:uncharacterized protein
VKKLFASEKIYVGKSKIKNADRGVYASCDIKKNEIIEICPVVQVSEHDTANLKESILNTYFFYFGKNNKRLLVALGFGSIYNHSHKQNAKYKIKPMENIIEFIAISNIKKDEEITIHYNVSNPSTKTPLWFEVT